MVSCDGFNRIMRSPDKNYRLEKALDYYKKEDYNKAQLLITDLIPEFRGTKTNEDLYLKFAYTYYYQKDYYSASQYFKLFTETFPLSKYAEEASFLTALCAYFESPRVTLDQGISESALESFQLFINQYPESELIDSCNYYVDALREKFEEKSYNNAKIYYDIEQYQAAVVALKNTLKEYPASEYEEKMRFMILESAYKLAMNSIEKKKEVRLRNVIVEYQNYIDKFASSNRADKAESYYARTLEQLELYQ